jgi:hypothetical protein
MMIFEGGMMNGDLEHRFQPAFEPMRGGWGNIHDGFSTLMSIAFLPAVPSIFPAAGFREG